MESSTIKNEERSLINIIKNVESKVNGLFNELKNEIYLPEDKLRRILTILTLLKEIGELLKKKRTNGADTKENERKKLITKLVNALFAGRAPRGILLYGPPGTGKSYLMSLLKDYGGLDVIKISGPEIISAYYGETERNLRRAFRRAVDIAREKGLGVIFIDEIDSIAPRRDLVRGELEPRLVGQLLTLMDGIEKEVKEGFVIVIASTNRIWALDPALRRPGRFDFEVEIELPDERARREIFRIYLCKIKPLLEEGIKELCDNYEDRYSPTSPEFEELISLTEGFSGADIFHLVREAILKKIEGKAKKKEVEVKVKLKDLIDIARAMKPSILRGYELKDVSTFCKSQEGKCRDEYLNDFLLFVNHYREIQKNIRESLCPCIANRIEKVIEVSAPRLRSRWFGETEERLREIMDKFLRLDRAMLIIYSIEALADRRDENLIGVRAELGYYLSKIEEAKETGKRLKVVSTVSPENEEYIDSSIATYFYKIKQKLK